MKEASGAMERELSEGEREGQARNEGARGEGERPAASRNALVLQLPHRDHPS